MKIIIHIIGMVLVVNSYAQTYSSRVSDSTILAFMQWEIKNGEKYSEDSKFRKNKKVACQILKFETSNLFYNDSIASHFILSRKYLFNSYHRLDSLFSQSDIKALQKQFYALKDTNWIHKIKGANIKCRASTNNQYYYSLPLFTLDEKYVLIKKSFYCGSACAYGGIYLYKKVSRFDWQLLRVLNGWMS